MQRALCGLVFLLLLGLLGCSEEKATSVDLYALDTEDLLPQLVRASTRHVADMPPDATEEQRRHYREHLVSEAEAAAQGWALFLALVKDGSFRTVVRRGAGGPGSTPDSHEAQGTWVEGPEGIRLEPGATDSGRNASSWPCTSVLGTWEGDALRFPALRFGKEDETTFLLRKRSGVDGSLLSLTPAERSASVRAALPAPTADAGFAFEADLSAFFGSPSRIGTLDLTVEARVVDGQPVWRVEETWDRVATGEWKRTVAWLDADLAIRRQRTDVKRSETADPTDVEGHSISTMTRTARGYRGERRVEGGDPRTWEDEIEERPLLTLGALLLFLRGCPDLPLDYECPCQGEAEVLGSRFTVLGATTIPCSGGSRSGRPAWAAASASEGPQSRGGVAVYLSPDDKRLLAVLAGFASGAGGGAYGVTVRGELHPRDFLPIGRPAWNAQMAAEQLALGTVWWLPEVIDGVLDWTALHARAKERGFEGDEQALRAEILAKLERRSRSLTMAEGNEVLRAVSRRDGRAPAAEEETRFEPAAPAAEFTVEVRKAPEVWKIVGLHQSIHSETRALDDAWIDPDRPEPVARGIRLWMWARMARVRNHPNHAAAVLHRLGPSAWRLLANAILEVGFPKGHLDGRTGQWVERLQSASVPASLLAYERVEGTDRVTLYKALDRRVGRPYGKLRRPPGASLPQPAADRHPAEIEILLRTLSSDAAPLRRIAARRLEQCGALARDAAPALEQALADPDESVREAARRALDAVRSREVVIRLARPLQDGAAYLYRGEPVGEPVLRAAIQGEYTSRVVLAGDLEPGRYTACFVRQGRAPLVICDVEVADAITTLVPALLPIGGRILVRQRDEEARELRVSATHLGAPPYERVGFYAEDLGAHVLPGLGAGRFRILLAPRMSFGPAHAILDRVVEFDGEHEIELELD